MSELEKAGWKPSALVDPQCFSATVEHATLAYSNTQEIIKFVDTKCNVLIALTTAISGFGVSLAKWNFELPSGSPVKLTRVAALHPTLTLVLEIVFVVSLVMTVVSIGAATWSVIVRPPAAGGFTVLFPVPRDLSRKDHGTLIAERLSGMGQHEILNEFREQLVAVGAILQAKLRYCRIATICILVQLGLMTAAVVCYLWLAFSSLSMSAAN